MERGRVRGNLRLTMCRGNTNSLVVKSGNQIMRKHPGQASFVDGPAHPDRMVAAANARRLVAVRGLLTLITRRELGKGRRWANAPVLSPRSFR